MLKRFLLRYLIFVALFSVVCSNFSSGLSQANRVDLKEINHLLSASSFAIRTKVFLQNCVWKENAPSNSKPLQCTSFALPLVQYGHHGVIDLAVLIFAGRSPDCAFAANWRISNQLNNRRLSTFWLKHFWLNWLFYPIKSYVWRPRLGRSRTMLLSLGGPSFDCDNFPPRTIS